jgi:hypothetical protein
MAVSTVAVGSIEIRSPRLADRIALTVMVASLTGLVDPADDGPAL